MSDAQLWFKSGLFEVEPGEDKATNPGCFGKQLAHWLRARLIEKGHNVEDVIPEDWGWCVVCSRRPFMLWVGCGSVWDRQSQGSSHTASDVTWTCFVAAEQPWLTRLFTRIDPTAVAKLFEEVEGILASEPQIQLTRQP
jgi:hypothetical protein